MQQYGTQQDGKYQVYKSAVPHMINTNQEPETLWYEPVLLCVYSKYDMGVVNISGGHNSTSIWFYDTTKATIA